MSRRSLATLALAIFAFAVAPAASARLVPGGGGEVVEAARFQLAASGGFKADVDASGHTVVLTLTRRLKHRLEVAQYTVPGQVTTAAIKAELGSLGSIDVQFRPTGPAVDKLGPPSGCDGYYVPGQRGTFTGVIRFRGEGGYVTLDAGRAHGEVAASTRWSCDGQARSNPAAGSRAGTTEGEEAAEAREYGHLTASSSDGRFFRVVGGPAANGHYGPAFFAAASVERGAAMKIARELAVEDFGADFKFDERLRSAAVRPPAPFHGWARYQRGKGGATSWTGSLRASLPGADAVLLTGAGFSARLSHDLPGD